MIKIERSTAVKPTVLRNGVRQPVTLNMVVTAEELNSIEAISGSITYSIDELEVKVVEFQPAKQPVIESIPEAPLVAAIPIVKPIVQPARKTVKPTEV